MQSGLKELLGPLQFSVIPQCICYSGEKDNWAWGTSQLQSLYASFLFMIHLPAHPTSTPLPRIRVGQLAPALPQDRWFYCTRLCSSTCFQTSWHENFPPSSFLLHAMIWVSSKLDHFSAKLNQSQPTFSLSHNSYFLSSARLPLLSFYITLWPDLHVSILFYVSFYPSPCLLSHMQLPRDRQLERPQPVLNNNNKNKSCSSHAKVAEHCGQDLPPRSPWNLSS